MHSIYDKETTSELISRVEKLNPIAQHLWGSMTVSQMLAHVQRSMEVPLGRYSAPPSFMSRVFGPLIKVVALNKKPFRKNLPTAPSYVIKEDRNFEAERNNVIETLRIFSNEGPAAIKNPNHPLFGKMNAEDWSKLLIKHFDHHLRQFGV